jgi:leader peptidase (prepilin peptidase)/N-methyltransferase
VSLAGETRIVFSETAVHLPDKAIPYEDVFYRESDTIVLHARTVELVDRCYRDVVVRLSPAVLKIGEEQINPEQIAHLEAMSKEIVLPREAMGLGDVKFMAAIGAFLGWQAIFFSLVISSFIGSLVGITLVILRKRALSSRLPYGPYIALAAAIWVFAGRDLLQWYKHLIAGWLAR